MKAQLLDEAGIMKATIYKLRAVNDEICFT